MRSSSLVAFLSGALSLGIVNVVALPASTQQQPEQWHKLKDTPEGGVFSKFAPPNRKRDVGTYYKIRDTPEGGVFSNVAPPTQKRDTATWHKIKDTPEGGVFSNVAPAKREIAKYKI